MIDSEYNKYKEYTKELFSVKGIELNECKISRVVFEAEKLNILLLSLNTRSHIIDAIHVICNAIIN